MTRSPQRKHGPVLAPPGLDSRHCPEFGMKKITEQYPDPEDMFADTRMTFGEHIEDLRTHLLRAIYGFCIGMLLAMCIGKPVMRFIAKPVEDQLKVFWDRYNQVKIVEVEDALRKGEYEGRRFQMPKFPINLKLLARRLKLPLGNEPEPLVNLVPAFITVFRDLNMEDALDPKMVENDNILFLEPDPQDFARAMGKFNLALKPPTLATMSVQEAFIVWFKVCLMTGLIISSPWVFYQIWAFVAAGLYPHEKRLVNVYLPFSLGLFLTGVFVCEFFVIPKAIEALLWFNEWLGLQPDLRLNEWLGFAILMPLVFGISFQTPLVMLFTERIGVFNVQTFREKRRMAILGNFIFAAVITPSTDPVSLLLLAVPMCLLYELGIIMCLLQPRSECDEMTMDESEEMIEA